jgi:hypothetical protein
MNVVTNVDFVVLMLKEEEEEEEQTSTLLSCVATRCI